MSPQGETHRPDPDPSEIQKEVVAARHDLDRLVGELDRRRHAMFDIRGQLRRRPVPFILGGLALLTAVGGTVALIVARRRRHNAWPQRVQRLRHAIAQAVRHPDKSHDEPSASKKIGTAGGKAISSVLAKAATLRLLQASRGH
jgi:antitoxin (DNA-binding transcriptional repressor) of toxin-antitoxin stability system